MNKVNKIIFISIVGLALGIVLLSNATLGSVSAKRRVSPYKIGYHFGTSTCKYHNKNLGAFDGMKTWVTYRVYYSKKHHSKRYKETAAGIGCWSVYGEPMKVLKKRLNFWNHKMVRKSRYNRQGRMVWKYKRRL